MLRQRCTVFCSSRLAGTRKTVPRHSLTHSLTAARAFSGRHCNWLMLATETKGLPWAEGSLSRGASKNAAERAISANKWRTVSPRLDGPVRPYAASEEKKKSLLPKLMAATCQSWPPRPAPPAASMARHPSALLLSEPESHKSVAGCCRPGSLSARPSLSSRPGQSAKCSSLTLWPMITSRAINALSFSFLLFFCSFSLSLPSGAL